MLWCRLLSGVRDLVLHRSQFLTFCFKPVHPSSLRAMNPSRLASMWMVTRESLAMAQSRRHDGTRNQAAPRG